MKDSDYSSLFLANYGQSELLENPVSEGNPKKKETPEVVGLQEFKFIAGSGFEPLTFGL